MDIFFCFSFFFSRVRKLGLSLNDIEKNPDQIESKVVARANIPDVMVACDAGNALHLFLVLRCKLMSFNDK